MNEAIAVIDVQKGFITPVSAHVPRHVRTLIEHVPFAHRIFTCFRNPPDSPYEKLLHWTHLREAPETDIVDELQGQATLIVDKSTYSSLTAEFLRYLETHRIREVYLAGIDTEACVLKTAVDLFEANYRPIVLADCCMSHASLSLHRMGLDLLTRFIGKDQIVYDSFEYFLNPSDP